MFWRTCVSALTPKRYERTHQFSGEDLLALHSKRDGHNTCARHRHAQPTLLSGEAQLYSVVPSVRHQKIIADSRVRGEEQSKHHVPLHNVRHDSGEF